MKKAWDEKGQAVIDAAKYSWSEIKRLLGDVGKSFMHVWDNGTGQRVVENLLQLLADMLNIVGDIAKAFANAWEQGDRGTRFIQSIFDALNRVLELIHHIATSFRDAWNDGTGERIAAHLIDLFTGIANIIGNLAGQFDKAWQHGNVGTSIFKTILGMVDDMLGALSDMANYTADWAKSSISHLCCNRSTTYLNLFARSQKTSGTVLSGLIRMSCCHWLNLRSLNLFLNFSIYWQPL